MRTRLPVLLAVGVLVLPTSAVAQIGQTAVLTGAVTDSTGAIMPGVNVSVSGPALIGGSRSTTTDANGLYRFPALPPGPYTVNFELSGFKPIARQNVQLLLGQTITVDARLEVGSLQEAVTVTGESPVVDVKSSAAQKNLTKEVMEFVPFTNRFGPAAMLLAPGINPNNYTSYGSGGSSSNSYMIDGVDVSDPEGGTIWLFANHNWIQEVQVIGLGASAEYGGFTGAASNSLFRSGSNRFSGLFETLYENDKLTDENISDEILEENPDLTPGTTDYVTDSTVQVGGPLKLDRAWFFTSFQYYRPKTAASGFPPPPPPGYTAAQVSAKGPNARLEKSPRWLFKPTLQLGPNDKLTGFLEYDSYTVDGRRNGATVAQIATLHQDSPEWSWNGNYTKVLSSTSVFDVKYSGFWGYYYLSPYNGDNTPGWYDVDEDFYSVNSYYFYNADRVRHQANASVTQFASGFAGDHNFKFGAEYERSYVKSELGYPGGFYVLASHGVPYYAQIWDGYLKDNINSRFTVFAQDSWSPIRKLTINVGLRWDHFSGFNKHLNETVFTTNAVAPRLGAAFDIAGDGKTVVRGHYGYYFDGAKSTYYDLLDPDIAPFYGAYIDPVTLAPLHEPYLLRPGTNRTMDDDINHPRMRQGIVGIERELFPGFSLSGTYVYRKNDNFIEDVLLNGEFATRVVADRGLDNVAGTGDETSASITTYRQLNERLDNQYLITNPQGASREYNGFEITATKRLANRWMAQGSWVIGSSEGNYNNNNSFGNSTEYNDPNQDPRFQPFREGRLVNDTKHIAKVIGMYQAPWDVLLSGAFFFTSGQRFQRVQRESLPQGRLDMFIEDRGAQTYDDQSRVDMKVEKQFRLANNRLGVTFEGFNIFNHAAITSRTVRGGDSYFVPQGLVAPRRWRLGLVYRF